MSKIDTINYVDVYEFYLSQFLGQCDNKYDSFSLFLLVPLEPEQFLRFICSGKNQHVFMGKIDTVNDIDVYEYYLSQFLGQCDNKYVSFRLLA